MLGGISKSLEKREIRPWEGAGCRVVFHKVVWGCK